MVKLRNPLRTKGRIRLFIGTVAIIWVLVAYETPNYSYGRFLWPYSQEFDLVNHTEIVPNGPPIKFNATIDFTTVSDYSVGVDNLIHAVTTITGVNRSDFGTQFFAIVYLYSGLEYPLSADLTTFPPPMPENLAYIYQIAPNEWRAEGDVAFLHPWINFTGPIFFPEWYSGRVINGSALNRYMAPQIKAFDMKVSLQPQSFTDTLTFNETAVKWGVIGTAVLLIYPVLPLVEDVLLGKGGKQKSGKKKNEAKGEVLRPEEETEP